MVRPPGNNFSCLILPEIEMTNTRGTEIDPIVVDDSDAEHGPPDTSDDVECAKALHRELNPHRFPGGFYYESDEEPDGKRKRPTKRKARKRPLTPQSRAHPYGAARSQGTVASSTVTHAVSGATLDTRGRPTSAPPGFSASQAQAGPAASRSASAPAGLTDLGDVSSDLGDHTPSLEQSFRAITLLDELTSTSLFPRLPSPVPYYLPGLEDLTDDQLREVALFGIDPDHVNEARLRRIQGIQVNPNPARGIRSG